jgi:hypothetical protein
MGSTRLTDFFKKLSRVTCCFQIRRHPGLVRRKREQPMRSCAFVGIAYDDDSSRTCFNMNRSIVTGVVARMPWGVCGGRVRLRTPFPGMETSVSMFSKKVDDAILLLWTDDRPFGMLAPSGVLGSSGVMWTPSARPEKRGLMVKNALRSMREVRPEESVEPGSGEGAADGGDHHGDAIADERE